MINFPLTRKTKLDQARALSQDVPSTASPPYVTSTSLLAAKHSLSMPNDLTFFGHDLLNNSPSGSNSSSDQNAETKRRRNIKVRI